MTSQPPDNVRAALRALPSVDRLLADCGDLCAWYGRTATRDSLRDVLDAARHAIRTGDADAGTPADLIARARDLLERRFAPSLRAVINATGVIVHTNLGRAPLADSAISAMNAVARDYSTLEFDLTDGKRGSRTTHAQAILCELTGAEAALVVNNNAAATVLMLSALAFGRGVVVSRGQLVEIGGGFRVPAIMAQSGAHLVEVGTTNRTRISDYAAAIDEQTAAIMRVHASNFLQIGFTESAPLAEMAALARERGLHLLDDVGSGALYDTAAYGLLAEPTVPDSVRAGADVVAFSGDKLLGGPQAGILVGNQAAIERLKRHPLARAFRADKLCLAALSATLDHYRRGTALTAIPVWQMIARPLDDIRHTAQTWAAAWGDLAQVIDGESTVGGGSLPGATLPTAVIALSVNAADDFLSRLRRADPPIIARIAEGRVLFDPRTVLHHQRERLVETVADLI
ncbi:MAG: L-seryl-tRNA(Sec) selenium transferase [Anaerolineaceae bacterium]|nr:MAG: L-seryl-tRNA(Sec) selenium transferase [Anaerolineaceae bacterium]